MKVVTWNVNSLNVRLEHVINWIKSNKPDILCIQETKQTNEKFILIVDEVQNILGKKRLYNQIKTISEEETCQCRILLSATPIANSNRSDFSVLAQILFRGLVF